MNQPNTKSGNFFLIAAIIVGIIAVLPQLFYQPFLLQGDHGRDLYIFQQTAQGAIPYLDYRTDNGPVMPFYYAAFLTYFGNSINSVLIGYALMIFLAGLLLYLIARKIISPSYAFLCAVWYWAWRGQEFFYTFNHIGAVVMGLATILCTIVSIRQQRKRYFILGFLSSVICMFIRPDIGLAALAGLLLSVFLFQYKEFLPQRSFFVISLSFIGGMVAMINIFVPEMFAPYWNSIHWNNIFSNLVQLLTYSFFFCTQNFVIKGTTLLLLCLFCIGMYNLFITRKENETRAALRALVCFSIFFTLFLAEYLLGFRFFRWVWVLSLFFLILFTVVYYGVKKFNPIIQNLICATLLFVCSLFLFLNYQDLSASKKDGSILHAGKTHLYMKKDQQGWIKTVQHTTQYILENTDPSETILTLPYDALYCFLSDRRLATQNPHLIGTTGEYVIPELESKRVPLIVISNRAFRHNEEHIFGVLGKDYGSNLWDYIQQNYTLAAQFGPWDKTATPILNHATQVYLRDTPFKETPEMKYDVVDDLL